MTKKKEVEEVVEEVAEETPEEEVEETESEEEEEVAEEIEKSIKALFASKEKGMLDKVQKLLDEHKEKAVKGVGAYAQDSDDRKAKSERVLEAVKSIVQGDFTPRYKEMTTDASGTPYAGYVTDDELSAEIRHLTTEYGVSAREMQTVTVSKNSYKANNLATDVSVYWVDEAGSIKSTQAVLGQGTLDVKKLASIVTLTRELLQETEVDFVSFLASRVAEGFAQAEDEAFFIGDGTSTYGSFTGLLENASVNEVTMSGTTFASITAEDLIDMIDATPQGALLNAKYYMHRSILSLVRKLREDAISASDGAGAFIYQSPAEGNQGTIWGYPVVLVEAMPAKGDTASDTSFVLFGDLRKACIRGVRGGIVADRFNAGVVRNVADSADLNLITSDREAIRWISQVGYLVIIPSAVTKLTTASASA